MKTITAKDVKELREISSAGMMDCKKALVECNGDIEKSIEWLRKKGIAKSVKKNANSSSEGVCNTYIEDNKAIIYEVKCETDFVSSNKDFVTFSSGFGKVLLSLENNNKDISEKEYDGKQIKEWLLEKAAMFGENIMIGKHKILVSGSDEFFTGYTHTGGKISVLILAKGKPCEEARNIAMHIAAMDPRFLCKEEIDNDYIAKEKEIIIAQSKDLKNKPENIQQKIIEGKIQKILSGQCLVEQTYVRDSSKKVKEVLKDSNIEVIEFIRYQIGSN